MTIGKALKSLMIVAVASGAIFAEAAPAKMRRAPSTPKYVFFFIGDGMGFNHVLNAQHFSNKVLGNDTTLTMLNFPVSSMARTHSASSPVTDSAAAGTALATGSKTRNNMLGMNADTIPVTSFAKSLFDQGWGVGLITTVAIDDATPGAFYAHVPSRSDYMTVGRQLAESGYQFAAGSGLRAARDKEGKRTDLLDYFAEQGVTVSYGLDGLKTEADRMLVLSTDTVMTWNVGYTVDSIPGALTLPAMTAAGIRQMQRVSPDHFFMMIEGGNIDHAGHANDGGAIVREVLNFDESIALAYQFYEEHPLETLIIVTADHETGGMSIGTTTTGYNVVPAVARAQKVSKEQFSEYVKRLARDRRVYHWADMEQYLRENLGFWDAVKISDEETGELAQMFDDMMSGRNSAPDQETLYATFNGFAKRVFELLNDKSGFGFTTTKHTGAMVPVFAIGVGAERFNGVNDNTDIPRKIYSIIQGDDQPWEK
jgi:alkaline phosphatase